MYLNIYQISKQLLRKYFYTQNYKKITALGRDSDASPTHGTRICTTWTNFTKILNPILTHTRAFAFRCLFCTHFEEVPVKFPVQAKMSNGLIDDHGTNKLIKSIYPPTHNPPDFWNGKRCCQYLLLYQKPSVWVVCRRRYGFYQLVCSIVKPELLIFG